MPFQKLTRLFPSPSVFRQYATKIKVELDPKAAKLVKHTAGRHFIGQSHPRKCARLPENIEDTIEKIVKEENPHQLIKSGASFVSSLHGRHVPLEENEKELLAKAEDLKIQQKLFEKEPYMAPDQFGKLVDKGRATLSSKIKTKENLWKTVDYDDRKCLQYLLLRGPADYAVLKAILSEIAKRDPNFQPRSLLDFGSGVGTVSWAVTELWQSCKEFYNVDVSTTMRELAGLILKRGNPQTKLSPSIFFKGFLPSTLKYTHDMVVSAYTLIELPSRKQRLETLLSLWNKTDSYLVIVEEGTNAGFRLVIEARDFILEMAEKEQGVAGGTGAHVFAPCAHDSACPRFLTSTYPCNFDVTYMPHPIVDKSQACRERYSYVVLKRGSKNPTQSAWPRIVEDVKARSKHCIARLCTPEGELIEVNLTKAKNADGSYNALRHSLRGDSFPVILTKYEDDELPSKERFRLRMLERREQREMEEEENMKEKKGSAEEEGIKGGMEEERIMRGQENAEGKGNKEVVKEKEQSNL